MIQRVAKWFFRFDGLVLLLRRNPKQLRHPWDWDLPGGRINRHESLIEGAIRNAISETGVVDIRATPDCPIGHWSHQEGDEEVVTFFLFLANVTNSQITLSEEHVMTAWKTPSDAKRFLPCYLQPALVAMGEFVKRCQ